MKKNLLPIASILLFIATFMSSCEIVGGIFKAGIWVGVILVVAIVAFIVWLISKAKK